MADEKVKLAIQSVIKEFASGTLTGPGILHRDNLSPSRNDAHQYEWNMGRGQNAQFPDPKNYAGLKVKWKK